MTLPNTNTPNGSATNNSNNNNNNNNSNNIISNNNNNSNNIMNNNNTNNMNNNSNNYNHNSNNHNNQNHHHNNSLSDDDDDDGDDDSDMFGPPRSSPPIGYHHHRSRVPMISPKLRQREERKRILQLCAHKLERIKDSEANLRRSVCINNTYCRLTDELRREKQMRYLQNLPKIENNQPVLACENLIFSHNHLNNNNNNNSNNNLDFDDGKLMNNKITTMNNNNNSNNTNIHGRSICSIENQPNHQYHQQNNSNNTKLIYNNINNGASSSSASSSSSSSSILCSASFVMTANNNQNTTISTTLNSTTSCSLMQSQSQSNIININTNNSMHNTNTLSTGSSSYHHHNGGGGGDGVGGGLTIYHSQNPSPNHNRKRHLISSNNLVNDLEILDRELSAINAPMPLIDPEITQGAEQLEKAISSSRKRSRSFSAEDESDRLVREALSQFYIPPPQRLISAIEDCPLDVIGLGNGDVSGFCIGSNTIGHTTTSIMAGNGGCSPSKRHRTTNIDLVDLDYAEMNQTQKDFEVIMDALRLGGTTTSSSTASGMSISSSDSCGQAAMMSESASVFHNLVVTSLET